MLTVVHILNQFFAGIGGEAKADTLVGVSEGALGAARGLQAQLGGEAEVAATLYFGDNYFQEHVEEATENILREVRSRKPQVVIAGPAFNSGRFGLACVEVCNAIAKTLDIPCVTAMHPENPAVAIYQEYRNPKVWLLPTTEMAVGMPEALAAIAQLACRLGNGLDIGTAQQEGYLPRGIRRIGRARRPGVDRAIDMLLKKLHDEPFVTEVPMETWESSTPAASISDPSRATIAVITTSGVVPWGNPDGFKTYRNTYWKKYNIAELRAMEPGRWEAVHGGYNTAFMNQNPHYGVPLDALRALEAEGIIGKGKLYPAYYVVPGNQGSPTAMRRIGEEIAADLRAEGIDGVLLVAT